METRNSETPEPSPQQPTMHELLTRYHDELTRRLMASIQTFGDYAFREQIVQDVFVRLLECADNFDANRNLFAYATRIAINLAKDQIGRHQRLRQFPETEEEPFDVIAKLERCSLEQQEEAEGIRRYLAAVSIEDQQILRLRFEDGLEGHDLAAAIGVRPDAARQRLSRALRRLRDTMLADEEGQS
ncbi:sigma-70 family RNA polymerase sigma factor [Tuwongella immobilis]|uniref:RNA polymerase sigma-70 region 2 domain-containing protein n=1 Tax=Tuwongella immobilis TaxID=692036 RepID=A0A6C2YJT7_9BACT|nr:sigma-70 family RNA polymerase sigma factor [Tuwongella immobilis]VIP01634.1 rna polymerase sigma sigma-70 family protein : Uncharacterized protein OS=Cystobacter violaceus Cb vi76 GN=Q664_09950 PE=4 SV=1: Sigma70_r2: Sigma70_r4_2 [Tuwongella immobilis]VTR98990.1 rna polymerase sigma sigma-70 family protein : Uncharacterized protein OS=Cystobacter violaceus Cb vi76 GN=Q664_09950 PE=4 SV=1: Sigma70_r2: Sigma70_r4_2 [Tuwongella immobilis]